MGRNTGDRRRLPAAPSAKGGSTSGTGVQGDSTSGYGVHGRSTTGDGVFGEASAADTSGVYGVNVNPAGWAGFDALRVQSAGQDGLRLFANIGRDFIRAGDDSDLKFRVTNAGAAYADGGWQGAADFAELVAGDTEGGPRPGELPVALVGIVPCKVSAENGAIRRGDLLVTSTTPGHAMRAGSPPPGTVVGKALQPLDAGAGVIEVLVSLQ